ncbi:MAG TPA: KH domain-containing protein [Candidatus Paceibacterota bacterium]|nr:KH domain-containing protein [Candidatus Paceibacterota bacterium]
MEQVQKIQDLVEDIVEALVDDSAQVVIEAITEDSGGGESTTINVTVAPGDVGKVIGKQGRTARSIRTILSGISMKLNHRFILNIIEAPKV